MVLFLFEAASSPKAIIAGAANMKWAAKGLLSRQTNQSSPLSINALIHPIDKDTTTNNTSTDGVGQHHKSAYRYKKFNVYFHIATVLLSSLTIYK